MKTLQEFTEYVLETIKDYLPPEYQDADFLTAEVTKNNDRVLQVLTMRMSGADISPQIHLKDMYEHYCETGSMEKVLENISNSIQESYQKVTAYDARNLFHYEKIKDNIILQVINQNFNQNSLKEIPHKNLEHTDLTAVFRIHIQEFAGSLASALVRNELFEEWGKTVEELYAIALRNTMALQPVKMQTMLDTLKEIAPDFLSMGLDEMLPQSDLPDFSEDMKEDNAGILKLRPFEQYVITNQSGYYGASVLLYPNLLEDIAQKCQSNFFILPSSIHELILIKDNGDMDAKQLQQMVMEVNSVQVIPEEQLSNQIYVYDHQEKTLTMATTPEETNELIEGLRNSRYENNEMDQDWEPEQ